MLKKMWISAEKGGYALRVIGGSIGAAVLAAVIVAACTVFAIRTGRMNEAFALALCLAVTALLVAFALRLRRGALRAVTVFFLTDDDRLFCYDARGAVSAGHGVLSRMTEAAQVQSLLNRLAKSPYLPAGAEEIVEVERIRDNRSHLAVVCRVLRSGGREVRRSCFVVRGLADEDALMRELERRERLALSWEMGENRNPIYILLCAAALVCSVALCVLSHPAVGRLPSEAYFPCLGLALLSLGAALYFLIRHRRGE